MTAELLSEREDRLSRLIVAIGRRLTPRAVRGHLVLELPSGRRLELGHASQQPTAELKLHNWQPVWKSMRRAAIGFCESYMDGDWDSPDPRHVLGFYLGNREGLDRAAKPVFFRSIADRMWHLLRNNSRRGSKRNIEAHYDLGNDFYRLWLDPSMTYSAAWFGNGAATLQEAQQHKYDLVLDSLDLKSGGSLLEIGCGWGGLAEAAVARGFDVTGITLSREQLAYAQARLPGQAEFRLQDYRDTRGSFDGIASIEMIEAVGEAHWPVYFRTLHDRLKPGAAAVVQAITIDEGLFPQYSAKADFIQRYIFPGGMLPTREVLVRQAVAAGLAFETVAVFGRDYARTLAHWRDAFEAAWPDIAAQGFDERFRRKWRLYLDYCEAGFAHDAIDVGIYRFRKPA